MRGRSSGSGSRAAFASGKRLREKNLSFAQTLSRKSWRVPHPQRRSGFGAVLSALGCPVCPWVTAGIARWVLGFTPLVEPAAHLPHRSRRKLRPQPDLRRERSGLALCPLLTCGGAYNLYGSFCQDGTQHASSFPCLYLVNPAQAGIQLAQGMSSRCDGCWLSLDSRLRGKDERWEKEKWCARRDSNPWPPD